MAFWLAVSAIMSDAALTVDWTNSVTTTIGTNFALNININSQGNYVLVSTVNVPTSMQFSVSGTTGIPALSGKTFSLTFSSVNGQAFKCIDSTGSYRIGMVGGGNAYRFDLTNEIARITADLSQMGSGQTFHLVSVEVFNSVSAYTIGLRNSSGVETVGATNQTDLSAISPVLSGGGVDYFDYRAASGSAGGWGSLVFDFGIKEAYPTPIHLANIFSSGCVLQRDKTVAVWGTCQPGETLTLTVHNQTKTTVADTNGNWRINLDPETAGGPFTMTVFGTRSVAVVLTGVYFGDVWLFTGQSNMALTIGQQVSLHSAYYPPLPDASDNFDDMRFAIIDVVSNDVPAADVTMAQSWSRWQADQLGNLSAVGYFFARTLKSALVANGMTNVPLGFVMVCKGSTASEQWTSAAALAAMGEPLIQEDGKTPSIYYNGMIAPIQNYGIKGAIWYQGEGNSRTIERVEQYPLVWRTMVESWRTQWGINFPVYFVQLAPYMDFARIPKDDDTDIYYANWAWARESQTECLAVTNTGMACIIDSGFQWLIHPPYKDRVGDRLARMAEAGTYGIATVSRGPTVTNWQISGSNAVITFNNVAGGLRTQTVDAEPDAEEIASNCAPVSVSANELAGFALCGTNQTFYWATRAEIISSNQVRISNVADVPNPVAIRYAWQSYPRCNLFNSAGLPAEPFRTDTYGYLTSTGADSTPVSGGISNRTGYAAQNTQQIDLSAVFKDVEDQGTGMVFSVTGNSASNVVGAAVSNQVLVLSFSGVAGSSTITVQARDVAGNIATASFQLTVETTTCAAWRYEYFTPAQLNDAGAESTVWGDLADPDGDGLPNLMEYALALNPTVTNQSPRTVSIVVENGQIKARFLKSKKAGTDPSVQVGLKTASGLTNGWMVLNTADVLVQDLGDTELREIVLNPGAPVQFVRWYVSRTGL